MQSAHPEARQKIDAYIKGLPDWSKAVCQKLRSIIVNADPSIVEDWKWGPHYSSNGMVCGYGAFQKHVKFTFFNGSAMQDPEGLFNHCVDNEFSRSIKFVAESEIDEKVLSAYIRESVAINHKGFKRATTEKTIEVPEALSQALAENKTAQTFFESLSYGYKKDFVTLVTTAKQEKTKMERIAKVVDHCAQGKKLNDKYKKTPAG